MEWIFLILWLLIINGGLGGQYILNWMGNQPRFIGEKTVGVSPGVMTWWREVSKLAWATIAVIIEIARGRKLKYFWPGTISMVTIVICAFTGVIENIGFFYLPRYYSPHIFAPYVSVYLAFLPFFGKFLFNAPIRREHWIGISLVILGLAVPHIPWMIGAAVDASNSLDLNGIIWIIIINCCLCSQQILNNKTVQTALKGVGPNALVFWREIWKMLFISSALFIFPLIAHWSQVNLPETITTIEYQTRIEKTMEADELITFNSSYFQTDDGYKLKPGLNEEQLAKVEAVISSSSYHRFFSLFDGSIIPDNWIPILFVIAAGLTGYIYSFGFFNLSRFSAHLWVPYTNVYLALLPFIMLLFGKDVTGWQVGGAVVVTAGLMVGVMDYSKNKVEEIEKKN
ncbi:MAG: hypothetical protein K9I71_11230 [Ignavibacteriales bacterium]|nr:hypothetical protein [Ignavibacteriales bacterium]MCF8316693.1 hypothetical protein [Ignavibacteriales bacterium]MCF8438350.1 hypothetical protein [Ignavibacteriales bacterium]